MIRIGRVRSESRGRYQKPVTMIPFVIIVFSILSTLFTSCKQSYFQVITQNDVGYWAHYSSPDSPPAFIYECSKKDSIVRPLDNTWTYAWQPPQMAMFGLKFRITNDTLFKYESDGKGYVMMCDTLPIVSFSKDSIVFRTHRPENLTYHRLPTKYVRKMLKKRVKLTELLKIPYHKEEDVVNISDVTWKLYGYGEVSSGFVRKSEALSYSRNWMNIIKFGKDDAVMYGSSTHNKIYGEYTISGSNITISDLSYVDEKKKEYLDGDEFCSVLPQCSKFIITGGWLQMFYNNGNNYLLFKVSSSYKIDANSK